MKLRHQATSPSHLLVVEEIKHYARHLIERYPDTIIQYQWLPKQKLFLIESSNCDDCYDYLNRFELMKDIHDNGYEETIEFIDDEDDFDTTIPIRTLQYE